MSESETGDDGLSRPLGQFRQALDRLEGSPRLARRNHINRFLQAAWQRLSRYPCRLPLRSEPGIIPCKSGLYCHQRRKSFGRTALLLWAGRLCEGRSLFS